MLLSGLAPYPPPHPGACSLANERSVTMNSPWWGVLSTAKAAPGSCHQLAQLSPLFLVIVIDGCLLPIMTPSSGYRTPAVPPLPLEIHSPPFPPFRPAPTAPCGSEPAAPDLWRPFPAWVCRRTERGQVAAGKAHGQGAQLPGLPAGWGRTQGRSLSAPFPSPERTALLPPAAAPPPRLPARPRWPGASQAASERGERSGMGLEGGGQGGGSGGGGGAGF